VNVASAELHSAQQFRFGTEPDCSATRAMVLPSALCAAMILVAAVTAGLASIDVRPLFAPYTSSALAISLLAVLSFVFVEFAKLARIGADHPIAIVKSRLIDRAPLMLLPAVVLPLFLIGYTASKCAIQFLVGYSWDGIFADADKLIFGDDVWRLTRRVLGSSHSRVWEWFYTAGWGGVFFITANAVALLASKRLVGVYFTAMLASWLIGGCLLAYGFSAAGPVFAGLFHQDLALRFAPMHDVLDASLGTGPIAWTQHYLAQIVGLHVAVKGGGISAMPSMHIATASIYVLAARRTRWIVPAVLFWTVIFVASGYFGYHYWIDGIAAAAVAAVCWVVAETAFAERLFPRELDDGPSASGSSAARLMRGRTT
jgi:hypothetical protein